MFSRSPDYEELLYISNLNSPSGDFIGKQQDSAEQGCARLNFLLATTILLGSERLTVCCRWLSPRYSWVWNG